MLHRPRTAARLLVALAVAAALAMVAAAANSPPEATFVGSFDGHAGQVYAVARVPKGLMLASGGFDDTARLWTVAISKGTSAASTTPGKILAGHDGPVLALAFSSSGRSLLTGGLDKTARLWWVRGAPAATTIKADRADLSSLAVRRQGDPSAGGVIAAGDQAGVINLWDASGEAVATIETPEGDVPRLAFRPGQANQLVSASGRLARLWQLPVADPVSISTQASARLSAASPDRSKLATASDKSLTLWDTKTGEKLNATFTLPGAKVVALAWGPPQRIAVAMDDGTVQVVDSEAGGKPVWASDKVASPVVVIALRSDGEQAVVGCEDRTIRVIRKRPGIPTGEVVDPPLGKHDGPVVALGYVPVEAVQLVSASTDGTAYLWDGAPVSKKTKNPLKRFDHKKQSVNALALSSDGASLFTGAADGIVRVFNVKDSAEAPIACLKHDHPVTAVDVSKAPVRIIVGTNDGKLHLWALEPQLELQRLSNPGKQIGAAWIFADASKVLSARDDNQALIWTPTARIVYRRYQGTISGIAFGKGSGLLYTASDAGELGVFDVVQGTPAEYSPIASPEVAGKKLPIRSVAALKGTLVAAGLDDGRVWVVDAPKEKKSAQPYAPIVAHQPGRAVTAITSTFDGERIISGSEDLTVKVWNAANGQLLALYPNQEKAVTSLALSANDRWLVAALAAGSSVAIDLTSPDRTAVSRQYLDGDTAIVGTGVWAAARTANTGAADGGSEPPPVFVTAWTDRRIQLWGPNTPGPYKTLMDHGAQVYAVAWKPGDKYVVTASADGWVRIWDSTPSQANEPVAAIGGTVAAKKPSGDDKPVVYALAYQQTEDGLLAIAGKDPAIRLWDVKKPEAPKLTGGAQHGDDAVYCLAFDASGKRLASGAMGGNPLSEGRVVLWEIKDQKPVKLYDLKKPEPTATEPRLTSVYNVAFSPDGRWLAAMEYGEPYEHVEKEKDAGKFRGSLLIWDVERGKDHPPSRTYLPLGAKSLGLAWVEVSSKGLLAVPASDGKVYLYQPPESLGLAR